MMLEKESVKLKQERAKPKRHQSTLSKLGGSI
jgi:hypothetical protein